MNLDAIRIRCAEIVGWTRGYGESKTMWCNPCGTPIGFLPLFTESADAALTLVSHLKTKGWRFQYAEFKDGKCGANFYFYEGNNCTQHYCSLKDSFSVATSCAFLRAHNINPEEL